MKDQLSTALLSLQLDLQKLQGKLEQVVSLYEAYEESVKRQANKDNKLLSARNLELTERLRHYEEKEKAEKTVGIQKKIASTINIFERILFEMSMGNPDFDLVCRSVIFPFVYERLTDSEYDQSYFLEEASDGCVYAVLSGRDLLKELKSKYKDNWLDSEKWKSIQDEVRSWWINEGFRHIYDGRYDVMWEADDPYGLPLMLTCQQYPSGENVPIETIQDKYYIHKRFKAEINESSNIRFITNQVEEYSSTHQISAEPSSPLHQILLEQRRIGNRV